MKRKRNSIPRAAKSPKSKKAKTQQNVTKFLIDETNHFQLLDEHLLGGLWSLIFDYVKDTKTIQKSTKVCSNFASTCKDFQKTVKKTEFVYLLIETEIICQAKIYLQLKMVAANMPVNYSLFRQFMPSDNINDYVFQAFKLSLIPVFNFLLERDDTDVNYITKSGHTLLSYALTEFDDNLPEMIFRSGVDFNLVPKNSDLPPILLCDDFWALKHIVREGGDVNAVDNHGDNWLFRRNPFYGYVHVKWFGNQGFDFQHENKSGETLLHLACGDGKFKVVQFLTQRKLDVNKKNNKGQTPLIIACKTIPTGKNYRKLSYLQIIQILIDKGANIEEKDETGKTPLMLTIQTKHYAATKYLLKCGANVDEVNSEMKNQTALMFSVEPRPFISLEKQMRIIILLLKYGADINKQDSNGRNALMYTSLLKTLRNGDNFKLSQKAINILKLLVANNANIKHKDNSGMNVIMLADSCGSDNLPVIDYLKDIGVKADYSSIPKIKTNF